MQPSRATQCGGSAGVVRPGAAGHRVHGNGAVYGKVAPAAFASRPAGRWNQAEATLIGNRLTLVLNGVKVIDDQVIDGATGGAVDDRVDEPGPILLQGDHGAVAFRNIRVKALRPTASAAAKK